MTKFKLNTAGCALLLALPLAAPQAMADVGLKRSDPSVNPVGSPVHSGAQTSAGRSIPGPKMDKYELDAVCGEDAYITSYEEDARGDPVPGTYEYDCLSDEEM